TGRSVVEAQPKVPAITELNSTLSTPVTAAATTTSSAINANKLSAWKTITLGTYKDVTALRSALLKNNIAIHPGANDMLSASAFTMSNAELSVDLVVVS